MHKERTIVGELHQINQSLQLIGGVVVDQSSYVAPAGPYEESFVRYSVGTGTFRVQGKDAYIIVTGRMFKLNGEEDGQYNAVFQGLYTNPKDLLNYPPPAEPPFDAPSPVPVLTQLNPTKAQWTFADGSTLSAPGPAPSYIAPLADGSWQFWVSAGAFITGGSGRYQGAVGQETSLGSTWFPSQPVLEEGTVFEAKVTHSFRVILGKDRLHIKK